MHLYVHEHTCAHIHTHTLWTHSLAPDALVGTAPTARSLDTASLVPHLPATCRLFTSDCLLSGQVNDDAAGDDFTRRVSSARPVEFDAKGPQRWHRDSAPRSRFYRVKLISDERREWTLDGPTGRSSSPLATLVPRVLTDCTVAIPTSTGVESWAGGSYQHLTVDVIGVRSCPLRLTGWK